MKQTVKLLWDVEMPIGNKCVVDGFSCSFLDGTYCNYFLCSTYSGIEGKEKYPFCKLSECYAKMKNTEICK